MKKKLLTDAQADEICYLIGEWYLQWKDRMVTEDGCHRLGVAKEYLKIMICDALSEE